MFTLRKARGKELYWVVNKETGKKYSKEPIPKERAKKQMKLLYMITRLENQQTTSEPDSS